MPPSRSSTSRERGGHGALVGDVAADRLEPRHARRRGRDLLLADRERHHAGALGEEPPARRLADPARPAGDDDTLALEPPHVATIYS